MTPTWIGLSRFGHAVLGIDNDGGTFDRVWNILQPRNDRSADRRNDVFDALHVWMANRHGPDALLTIDGYGKNKGLPHHDRAGSTEFNGFRVWTASHAWAFLQRLIARQSHRENLRLPRPGDVGHASEAHGQ